MIKVLCTEVVMGKEYKELGLLGKQYPKAGFLSHALAELYQFDVVKYCLYPEG